MKSNYKLTIWIVVKEIMFSMIAWAVFLGSSYAIKGTATLTSSIIIMCGTIAPLLGFLAFVDFKLKPDKLMIRYMVYIYITLSLLGLVFALCILHLFEIGMLHDFSGCIFTAVVAGFVYGIPVGIFRQMINNKASNQAEYPTRLLN